MYLRQSCGRLVLVDLNQTHAKAEALDLMQGQGITGRLQVEATGYEGLKNCQVIVVAAGVAQRPGETRLDLLSHNAKVFKDIAEQLDRNAPDAVIVVASNPVDILTFMLKRLSGRPSNRIVGTGTMLDTTRLHTLLGDYYQVDPQSVHGYILGEHGDSEFAAWSTVTIGGLPVKNRECLSVPYNRAAIEELADRVKNAAYEIIKGKGYTNWAIGLVIARLVEVILDDSKTIQPVSVALNGEYALSNLALSLPARVGANGVETIIELTLDDQELFALRDSATTVRKSLSEAGF